MSVFEYVLIAIGVFGALGLFMYIAQSQPDRRMDMNDIPGANSLALTEEEAKVQNDFIAFLKENKAFNSNVYLDLGNYNVNPGSKGVFKLGSKWVVYEMGGWKDLKVDRRFDDQITAYQYFAKLRNLDWEVTK